MRLHTLAAIVLLAFNAVLLLGQVWPEGAPPFARAANIVFACGNLAYFAWALISGRARHGPTAAR